MTADPEHEALLTWDYTSEVWSWSPADGPWSPAHGRPKTSGARLSASTGSLGPDDAYEFWREVVIYDFAAGRMDAEAKREFRGAGEVLAAPRGSIFTCRLGPLSGERTRAQSRADGCDEVSFGLVRKGRRRTVGPDGTVSSSEAGDFYVYDAAMPCRLEWTAHESIYLAVPRDLLRSTFGGDPPPAEQLRTALQASGLAPFLKGQLDLMARRWRRTPERDQMVVFDAALDLLLAALAGVLGSASAEGSEAVGAGQFAAACRFIEANLPDPDLDPVRIARSAGCSRATLYRLFARRELTVAGYVRDRRLQRFMRLLRVAGPDATIAALAARCGFFDPPTFNQTFRRRFGVSPGELRREAMKIALVRR